MPEMLELDGEIWFQQCSSTMHIAQELNCLTVMFPRHLILHFCGNAGHLGLLTWWHLTPYYRDTQNLKFTSTNLASSHSWMNISLTKLKTDTALLQRITENFWSRLQESVTCNAQHSKTLFLKNEYDLINCGSLLFFQWNCLSFIQPNYSLRAL
jgi:hypothetical protein